MSGVCVFLNWIFLIKTMYSVLVGWTSLSITSAYFFRFLREHLKPVVKTEEQFLYVCHLVGPFLQRLHSERTKSLMEVSH